jgi:DNA (cytosine-5)-methyltransferase 1
MSFPPGWTALREMKDSDEADTARYHALGNAVTPPVAEWLATRVHAYLTSADGAELDSDEVAAATA